MSRGWASFPEATFLPSAEFQAAKVMIVFFLCKFLVNRVHFKLSFFFLSSSIAAIALMFLSAVSTSEASSNSFLFFHHVLFSLFFLAIFGTFFENRLFIFLFYSYL